MIELVSLKLRRHYPLVQCIYEYGARITNLSRSTCTNSAVLQYHALCDAEYSCVRQSVAVSAPLRVCYSNRFSGVRCKKKRFRSQQLTHKSVACTKLSFKQHKQHTLSHTPAATIADPASKKLQQQMEGFLTKKGGVSWKKRWFTLDDHVITYYSKQGDAKPRGRMVLNAESRVTNLPTRANAFQVITNNKALMVYADTGEEKEQWFTTLNSQIEALKDRAAVRRARRNTR
jgi:PH domain